MATAVQPLESSGSATTKPTLSRRDYVRALRLLTLWMLGLGLVARTFRYFRGVPIWNDEAAVGLNLLRRDFEGLTHALDELQVAPILFLWAERLSLLTLGSSGLAMRLLPFLLGIGGLLLFWDLARRAVSPTAATIAVSIMAVARWPVMMSSTLKPYTGDMFFSVLLMTLAVRWRQRPERLWPLLALAAVVPVALGMSYPTVFVAGAVSVYLLPTIWRQGNRRTMALFALYNFSLLAAFAGVYALVLRQASDPQTAFLKEFMRDYWAFGFPPDNPFEFVWWLVKRHTGRMMSYPYGDNNGGSTLNFLLFALGVFATWRSAHRGLLLLCLTPFALNMLAAIVGQYPYGACTRLTMHLAPAICLMIALGLSRLLELTPRLDLRRRWLYLILLAFAGWGVGQMVFDAIKPHRDIYTQWAAGIGDEVERNMRPGDVLIYSCHSTNQHEAFDWYMERLGSRTWKGDPLAFPEETRRVWLVVLVPKRSAVNEELHLLAAMGKGWKTIARTEYVTQLFAEEIWALSCTVRCLSRDPVPLAERPLLRSRP